MSQRIDEVEVLEQERPVEAYALGSIRLGHGGAVGRGVVGGLGIKTGN